MLERATGCVVAVLALGGCCFGGTPTGMLGPIDPVGAAPAGNPVDGVVTLGPGFAPDPWTATGTAGGPVSADTLSADCRGYISAQPNHVIRATGAFANLRIVVASPADTTLVVQRADGSFECNDDFEGLNPQVAGMFGPGEHRVWIGTYSADDSGAPYVIGVTELATVTAASLAMGGVPEVPADAPTPPPGSVPTACGQADPGVYGGLAVGMAVTLGRHTPLQGVDENGAPVMSENWAEEMGAFVGQRTLVTQLSGVDDIGCPGIRVAVDGGQFFWRIRDLAP
jgi:hypothetical protein